MGTDTIRARAFTRVLDNLLADATGQCLFIDTAQVLLPYPLSRADRARLDQLLRHPAKHFGTKAWRYSRRVLMRQPSAAALTYLSKIAPRATVNRVDVAYDISMPTRTLAAALHAQVRRALVQHWRGRRRMNVIGGTDYWAGSAWERRSVVVYSDRVSKVTGKPCVHIETRFATAAACRRAGLGTPLDLVNADLATVLACQFAFAILDWERLNRTIRRHAMAAARIAHRQRRKVTDTASVERVLRRVLARAMQTADETPHPDHLHHAPAQALLDAAPDIARRALIRVPSRALIKR